MLEINLFGLLTDTKARHSVQAKSNPDSCNLYYIEELKLTV